MTQFVSYAQNYEDVMLWRALKHVENGFYVDVGANHPKIDSVTYAFYVRGWRGINIEPIKPYYDALCEERNEDINLQLAVGASEGQIIFYEVPETGNSSAVAEAVFNSQDLGGRDVFARMVPVSPLNKILEEHARGEIHFLKIDVEGYEKSVLAGLDLTRWRPWILVVEATIPNSPAINPEFPEEDILSAGYSFVYFDGLNRFFVADEHAELNAAFSLPPNVFDSFVIYREVDAAYDARVKGEQLEGLRVEMKQMQERMQAEMDQMQNRMQSEMDQMQNRMHEERGHFQTQTAAMRREGAILKQELTALREKLRSTNLELELSKKETEAARRETEAARNEAEAMRLQYVNILYSMSYRVTAPLRSVYRLGARLRNGFRNSPTPAVAVIESSPVPALAANVPSPKTKKEQYFTNLFHRELDRRKNAHEEK